MYGSNYYSSQQISQIVTQIFENIVLFIQNPNIYPLVPLSITFHKSDPCPPSKKYKKYSIDQKNRLISQISQQLQNCSPSASLKSILRKKSYSSGIHIKNLSRWWSQGQIYKKQGGRKPLYPQIQQKLSVFVRSNPMIKRRDIMKYARECYHGIKDDEIVNERRLIRREFRFSKGWYERFRVRCLKKQQEYQIQHNYT